MRSKIHCLSAVMVIAVFISACSRQSTNAALQAGPTPPQIQTPIPSETDRDIIRAVINGKEVSLSDHGGKCRFTMEKTVVDLDLPAGCDFHRLPNREVRVFPSDVYKDSKRVPKEYRNLTIVLIEHSVRNEENAADCRTQLQAVKIEGEKAAKSILMDNLASCPPFQWDAKNFTALFERRKM